MQDSGQDSAGCGPIARSRSNRKRRALLFALIGLILLSLGGCVTDGRILMSSSIQVEDLSGTAPASHALQTTPSAPAERPPRSLPTGTIIESTRLNGNGRLAVENSTERDAVAKLVDPLTKTRVAVFYVRANSDHTLSGVPDGTYKLIFAMGRDWDSRAQTFQQNPSFSMFEDDFAFTTTTERKADGIYQSTCRFSVTLHPVVGGKARTETITHDYFSQF